MRRLAITLGIAVVVLALGIGLPGLLRKKSTTNTNTTVTNQTNSSTVTNTTGVTSSNTNSNGPLSDEQVVTNLALTFAERYGTVSNQNPNQNLIDASSLMTAPYRRLTLAGIRPATVAKTYEGTTTHAVAVRFDKLTPGLRGTVIVTTSRQDFRGGRTDLAPYRQDLSLSVQAEDATWHVDSAVWLARGSTL